MIHNSLEKFEQHRGPLTLVSLGVALATIGFVFPGSGDVLLLLGGSGIFFGVLVYAVDTAETMAPALTGDLYRTTAANVAVLSSEFDESRTPLYTPTEETGGGSGPVERGAQLVLSDTEEKSENNPTSHIHLRPSGMVLFREFEEVLIGELSSDPDVLTEQLVDSLHNQFELVQTATIDDVSDQHVTVGVAENAFGPLTEFDHPVQSFLAVGLAVGLNRPVTVAYIESTSDQTDHRIRYTWSADTD